MQPAFPRSLASCGLLTLLLVSIPTGAGQAWAVTPLLGQQQGGGESSANGASEIPDAPVVASSAPAQLVFNELNGLLQSHYSGLSTVDRQALAKEYQRRLNAVCAPNPLSCTEEKAYPVLEAEVTALNDPHSFFMVPDEYQDFLTSASGGNRQQFGVKLAKLDGENRLVTEVVPQGAAEAAGLRRGDVLVTMNGEPYRYTDLQAARREGRLLKLGVDRQGKRFEISVQARESSTRDLPRLSFVGPQKNVAVLRIPTFLSGGGVGQKVHELVREAERAGAKGIVVDLRGNTGGRLDECDSAVAAFVPTFTRVARTGAGESRLTVSRGRRLEDGTLRNVLSRPQLWTGPMAVLVNEISASCSEFFAHEIQYAKRGPVIGEQTAGVGNTATKVFGLSQGAGVQLTITHYVKPDGRNYPSFITPDQLSAEGEEELRRLSKGTDVMLNLALTALETAPALATSPR